MKHFLYTPAGKDYLYEEYVNKERSTYDIAKEQGCYANLIRRALASHGIERRTKNDAQRLALATNRHPHPTKGKQHDPDTKAKIAESVSRRIQERTNGAKLDEPVDRPVP